MNEEIINRMKDDEAIRFIAGRYKLSPEELLDRFFSNDSIILLESNERQLLNDFYEYLNKKRH